MSVLEVRDGDLVIVHCETIAAHPIIEKTFRDYLDVDVQVMVVESPGASVTVLRSYRPDVATYGGRV